MLGSERPFLPELHAIRPHPGQSDSAANIHRLLRDSAIMDSHRDDLAHAVQDAYSMRCAPQVAGAARDTLEFVRTTAARELLSVVIHVTAPAVTGIPSSPTAAPSINPLTWMRPRPSVSRTGQRIRKEAPP